MSDRHLVARQVLAGSDTSLREEEWEDRKAEFHKTLCDQFPINKLRASVIEFDYETKASKVFISAYLVRSRQAWLNLRSSEGKQHDPFSIDIAMLEEARPGIRDLYESALKSDADPSSDPDLAHCRKQIWASRKVGSPPMLTIYSTVDGEDVPLNSIGRWLPHASMARVTFKIDRLSRHECRVRIRSMTLEDQEVDDVDLAPIFPTRHVDLVRDQSALGEVAGRLLASAMERQIYLESNVLLEFSWIDGALARWTLCEMPTEMLRDAKNSLLT